MELYGQELAAVVVVQAIRERIDDDPGPDELTAAIETAYEKSPLPQADYEDHLGAVVDAIQVSGASPAPIGEAALPESPDGPAPHEPPFDDPPFDSGTDEIDDDLL